MEEVASVSEIGEKADQGKLFAELVREYAPRLFKSALMLSGNRHDAEDLVQLTFIAAHKAIDNFRGEAKYSTWLHSILINLFRNELRKKRRWRRETFSEVDHELYGNIKSADTPLAEIQYKEFFGAVMKALSSLPEKQRTVMVLRSFENMSYSEIADVVHCSVGTVKSRIHSARKKIIERLKASGLLPEHIN